VLIREEAKAAHITRIITEINDRLVRKLLAITESQMGPPPVSYCWIVFGSEGRKEQTFSTDQDNAIIYDEPGEKAGEASNYFAEFAARMRRALEQCGFPPCTANYMASNPQWCQPLSVWKKYYSRWISTPTPEAVLRSLIFFDFRPLYGNQLLAEQLRAYLSYTAKGTRPFSARWPALCSRTGRRSGYSDS
jgi:CBS domain-containing protein